LEIRQFKLANDDEIMCEVVEYHEEDDAIVIRKTMKMVQMDNMANGTRYYAFRPFMMYQMTKEAFQIINCAHIISEANPNQDLILEYFKAIETAMEDEGGAKENMDDMRNKYNAFVKKQHEMLMSEIEVDSGAGSNIIKFSVDKNKLH
tara:strand:+ start:22 stop:465 length:444 start_codon:yes stop_codon:yes gene_type:complete